MHQLDVFRQNVLEAEPVDGMRVPAAHLHDPVVTLRISQAADFARHLPDHLGVAKLVDVFHPATRGKILWSKSTLNFQMARDTSGPGAPTLHPRLLKILSLTR